EAESRIVQNRSEHFVCHFLRQDTVRLSIFRESDLDGEVSKVGGGCPEAGGGHFRIDVPHSMDRLPIPIASPGCCGSASWRERLFVAAIGHTDFIEHRFAKQNRERLATHI